MPDTTAEIKRLAAAAFRGAESAASLSPDEEEFAQVANFIGKRLEERDDEGLATLEARIRGEDRRALAWYLNLLRTLAGTTRTGPAVQHLVFIPIRVEPALSRPLELGSTVHEIDGGLEFALDLGTGSFMLSEGALGLQALERMSPVSWRDLVRKPEFAFEPTPIEEYGALVGRWSVLHTDQSRLSRKLLHAMQQTPALKAWRMRTEALLEELVGADYKVRVFPAVLLQDLFTLVRQMQMNFALERAARQCPNASILRWSWLEKTGELNWRISNETGDALEGTTGFPDEPTELVEGGLQRLAQRLQLRLEPPLGQS